MLSKYKFYIIAAVVVTLAIVGVVVWRKKKSKTETTENTQTLDAGSESSEQFTANRAQHLAGQSN